MSLFENVYFLNEGEQAEEYKARKQKEKEEAEKKDKERFDHRYNNTTPGYRYTDQYYNSKKEEDKKRDTLHRLFDTSIRHVNSAKEHLNASDTHMRLADMDDKNPELTRKRDHEAAKKAGVSPAVVDRLRKIDDWDYEETEDDEKFVKDFYNSEKGRNFVRLRGTGQSYDALARHKRRHPDQYKESGIFESVSFINE